MSIQCIPNFIGPKDAKTFSRKFLNIVFGSINLILNCVDESSINDDIYLNYININEITAINTNICVIGVNFINVIPVDYSDSDYVLAYIYPFKCRYHDILKDILGSDYKCMLEYYIVYDRKMNAFYYTSVPRQVYFFL